MDNKTNDLKDKNSAKNSKGQTSDSDKVKQHLDQLQKENNEINQKSQESLKESIVQNFATQADKTAQEAKQNTKEIVNAIQQAGKDTSEKLDKMLKSQDETNRKVSGLKSSLNSLWIPLLLMLALIIFCCFFKGCKSGEVVSTASTCKVDTKIWVPGVGAITDPEALAALKEKDTIYLSFSLLDGERFKKIITLATAQLAGKKIEYQIDFLKQDSTANFCTFVIQDFRISEPDVVAVQDTVIPNPAKFEAPRSGKGTPKAKADDSIPTTPPAPTGNDNPLKKINLTPVADAQAQLADRNNYKTNVTFGKNGDVLHVVYTNKLVTDVPNGTFVPVLQLTKADSLAKGLY